MKQTRNWKRTTTWAGFLVVLAVAGIMMFQAAPVGPAVPAVQAEEPDGGFHHGQGCTPGFWKNHTELWVGILVDVGPDSDDVLSDLKAKGPGGERIRHLAAGLLNARALGAAYPFAEGELSAQSTEDLVAANEAGCPLDG